MHAILLLFFALTIPFSAFPQKTFVIDVATPDYLTPDYWEVPPAGGDTIHISASRTMGLKFKGFQGAENDPLVLINQGGQVHIVDSEHQGAISFVDCTHIKITGNGHPGSKYGFRLQALNSGLDFSGLSSDCEAAFIMIENSGFFGIVAKKDFHGDPPSPPPVFSNLVIHDCFIRDVDAGMYLGETISPGMEFRHVRIYNNIVKNTGREALQIANMVEDVEIYNNTLIKAGINDGSCQNNILQIGDNTVARVFNNIVISGNGCGIISFGMGNNYFFNNYIGSCTGIFIDNRKFSDADAPIVISDNYLTDINDSRVIKNMNEVNPLEITGNTYDTDIPFFENASGNETNVFLENNQEGYIHEYFIMEPGENYDTLTLGTPMAYKNMGAPDDPVTFLLFKIAAGTTPENSGTVTGTGTYQHGESATLTATPATGYTFRHWSENGNVIATAPTLSFEVTQNRSLTARFALATGTNEIKESPMHLKIYPNPAGNWLKFSLPADYHGKNIQLSIVSVAGKKVMMKRSNIKSPLDVSTLSPGMYLLIVKRKDENYRGFFIKK